MELSRFEAISFSVSWFLFKQVSRLQLSLFGSLLQTCDSKYSSFKGRRKFRIVVKSKEGLEKKIITGNLTQKNPVSAQWWVNSQLFSFEANYDSFKMWQFELTVSQSQICRKFVANCRFYPCIGQTTGRRAEKFTTSGCSCLHQIMMFALGRVA